MIRSHFQNRADSESRSERWLAAAIVTLLRMLALVFLALSLWIWSRTIGYQPVPAFEAVPTFDAMNTPSQIYHAMLCVLLPVAAVGLWTTLAWGRVVWLLAIGVQIIAYGFYRNEIGVPFALFGFHIASVAFYLALEIGLRLVVNDE